MLKDASRNIHLRQITAAALKVSAGRLTGDIRAAPIQFTAQHIEIIVVRQVQKTNFALTPLHRQPVTDIKFGEEASVYSQPGNITLRLHLYFNLA